jgi:hypothetical protein
MLAVAAHQLRWSPAPCGAKTNRAEVLSVPPVAATEDHARDRELLRETNRYRLDWFRTKQQRIMTHILLGAEHG